MKKNSGPVSVAFKLCAIIGIFPSGFSRVLWHRTGRPFLLDSLFAEVVYRNEKLWGDNSWCFQFSKIEHSK